MSAVIWPWWPIFVSGGPIVTPGLSFSGIRSIVHASSSPSRQSMQTQSATIEFVIHRLRPVTVKPSSVRVATVFSADGVRSEDASGSVVANEKTCSPEMSFGNSSALTWSCAQRKRSSSSRSCGTCSASARSPST